MKKQLLMLSLCGLVGFLGGAACGVSTGEMDADEQTPITEPATDATQADASKDGRVEAMAKNCQTTCTGRRADGSTCGVIGFGSTTFLGGCTKACRFARQDADTKSQQSGCQLEACNDQC
ncbi:MAG: hypothetical protein ABW123_28230 [Cystobacter sp.]